MYATPTSDQIQRFWIEVKAALEEAILAHVFEVNETMHAIGLPGGITIEGLQGKEKTQRIRAKTAWNADTLRGDFADDLILDEWQLMDEDAWHQVGAPMVIDNNGDAIFVYTPPSLHSKSVSKAKDKRHASKLYKAAQAHEESARLKGLKPEWRTFHWTSHDNPYLSKAGLDQVTRDMTALSYRQEILAEDTDEAPGALWKRATIEKSRVIRAPESLLRVGIGLDPPGGATECGIVSAGTAMCSCKGKEEEHGFVLDDVSTKAGAGPEIWAPGAIRVYYDRKADFVAAEKNFGGDMVKHTIATYDKKVNVIEVHATRGKAVRAEPVSALYEQGNVHHVGSFPDLEDEQCQWVPGQTGHSPNRMDSLVWILTKLLVKTDYSPASDGVMFGTPIPGEFRPPSYWPTEF